MDDPARRPAVRSVSEVTRTIRGLLRSDERLADVWVEGEIGRLSVSSAGHAYFSLNDDRAQLPSVMFREERTAARVELATGLRVLAHGRIDVYEANGVYQLYVDALQPAGVGDLALRFEELKARLAAEGLFDVARKRPLPERPATIAVVTSETGAVWHDIRTVVGRRWPLSRLLLVPCLVQGEGAPASILAALERLERWIAERPDGPGGTGGADGAPPAVTIVARGGGSLEDLAAFNDERVVRAVARHPIPLIAAIGHEVDVTLTDFAADLRAPTPSAAAELVVPDVAEVGELLLGRRHRLRMLVDGRIESLTRELVAERRTLDGRNPATQLAGARERAGHLLDRASAAVAARIVQERGLVARSGTLLPAAVAPALGRRGTALAGATAALAALAPAATLARGYAIVRHATDGRIVRDPAEAPTGTSLEIDLASGALAARSEGPRPRRRGEASV
ncbi:MAG: exodeoxyribonuclease large subunit [Chloroflexota bacterium]|jgi:exodeoxyribonuclease VII large subunit